MAFLLAWSFVVLANLSTVSPAKWQPEYYLALGLAILPVAYVSYHLVRWGRRKITPKKVAVIAGAIFATALVASAPVAVAESCQYVFAVVGFWCFPPLFGWGVWFATCFPIFGYVPTGYCDPAMFALPAL